MSGEFAGLVVEAEQGGGGDGDLDGWAQALGFREVRVVQGGDAEVDEGVGAALIGGARVGRGGDRRRGCR